MRIRRGGKKRLKPSKTRCGRQESCGVVRNPINLDFVVINSSRSYVLIIFMIIMVQHCWVFVSGQILRTGAFFAGKLSLSPSSSWVSSSSIIMSVLNIRRVALLFDFPSRQVTSSRSSVLDLLLLTKAVSKNWNFVSTFNTWRLWNRLMYDLNKLWKLWSTHQCRKFQRVRCN